MHSFLWPLKVFPDTVTTLLPPDASPHLIPEHNLLPDPITIERQRHLAYLDRQKKKRKIYSIRKEKLDLSRAPFRLQSSLELKKKINEGRVVNKQFHYHSSHSFVDQNSVYLHSHGEVSGLRLLSQDTAPAFDPSSSAPYHHPDDEEKKENESYDDIHSSVIGSGQRFHLGLEDESVVQRQHHLQHLQHNQHNHQRPSTAPANMNNHHQMHGYDDRNSESYTFNSATDDNAHYSASQHQQQQQESSFVVGSENALRSNLFSEHSNDFNIQPLLHVPLKRHRAVLGLNKWQVRRGDDLKFKFISRRTKEKIRREKQLAEQEQEAIRKDLASKGIFMPMPVKHKKQRKTKVKVVLHRNDEGLAHGLDAQSTLVSSIGEYS